MDYNGKASIPSIYYSPYKGCCHSAGLFCAYNALAVCAEVTEASAVLGESDKQYKGVFPE